MLKRSIAAALVLMLAAGLFFMLRHPETAIQASSAQMQSAEETETDAMLSFRTLRQQLRAMEKAQLNEISAAANAEAEIRSAAQRQLLELCAAEEAEMTLEGALKMLGYADAVVTVHRDCVNVILKAELITQQESAAILDLVCRETGTLGGNVKIIPIN